MENNEKIQDLKAINKTLTDKQKITGKEQIRILRLFVNSFEKEKAYTKADLLTVIALLEIPFE